MNSFDRDCATARSGFSLVEVSLALLVAGVGLMAIFALFPSGLDAGRAAEADVRAAQIAESIFDTLRAEAPHGDWDDLPDRLLTGFGLYPFDPDYDSPLYPDGQIRAYAFPYEYQGGHEAADYTFQYRLRLNPDPGSLWRVVLQLWNRTATPAAGAPPDHVYYTEIYRWKAVP